MPTRSHDEEAKSEESMIKELNEMPPESFGFEATGKLRAEDYRDVVLPALERAAATGEVRFVIVMKEFDGMTGGAVWQDLKVGFRAPSGLEADCTGHRHRVDAAPDEPLRLDDPRRNEDIFG